jgi:ubiquinone/menaquinone biosynthesis C-methylase UbiE
MSQQPDPRQAVARVFDGAAATYDATGVAFFGPIADTLVALLDPQEGERVLDIGCGRGAFLLPAAAAVGPAGRATGIDLSPRMVESTAEGARALGLPHVEVAVGDAQDPDLPDAAYDLIGSSLVLFFLPDPAAALAAWLRLLTPGGRLGITTFGPQDEVWKSIDALFAPYLPPQMLDARGSGRVGPFASDAGVEGLLVEAGFEQVRTVTRELDVRFADADQWHAFSWSTGQRAVWERIPQDERGEVRRQAEGLLEQARAEGGHVLRQQVRYTLGVRP